MYFCIDPVSEIMYTLVEYLLDDLRFILGFGLLFQTMK